MRKFTLLLFLLVSVISFSQTYTSAGDGNWTNPTTWSPIGVPVTFDEVSITHAVTLDTDFLYSSGEITIESGGSLIEDSPRNFVIDGGELYNYGTFNVNTFVNYSGRFENYAISTLPIILNDDIIENYFEINGVDSILNNSILENDTDADLYFDRFFNNGIFENRGYIEGTDFWNENICWNYMEIDYVNLYNNDTLENYVNVYSNDCTNAGYFLNYQSHEGTNDFTNMGIYENLAIFVVDVDFSNIDSLNGDGHFINNGSVYVGQDFLNADTISGNSSGTFCVESWTGNSGAMIGEFDFCDISGGAIDINTGTVDPSITYCTGSCGVGIETNDETVAFNIYPNPMSEYTIVELTTSEFTFELIDITGKTILSEEVNGNSFIFNKGNIESGLYLYQVIGTNNEYYTGKLIIE